MCIRDRANQPFACCAVLVNEDDDRITVHRCREGDRAACEQLVVRYQRPVFNAALRLLRNPEDAKDVAQTTFLKAFGHLADYDPSFKFYSWIYRIAVNEALTLLGSRKSFEKISGEEDVYKRQLCEFGIVIRTGSAYFERRDLDDGGNCLSDELLFNHFRDLSRQVREVGAKDANSTSPACRQPATGDDPGIGQLVASAQLPVCGDFHVRLTGCCVARPHAAPKFTVCARYCGVSCAAVT